MVLVLQLVRLKLGNQKANLIAKAEIVDIINGEMNERATFSQLK